MAIDVAVLCLAHTLQHSVALQSKQQDLSRALSDVMVIKKALQNLQEDADNQFNLVFKNIIELGEKSGSQDGLKYFGFRVQNRVLLFAGFVFRVKNRIKCFEGNPGSNPF